MKHPYTRMALDLGRGCGVFPSPWEYYHLSFAFSIDCAGILKLRNSDIELRKGETDIGRKNTRVRLVFRVHVPQGGGKVVSVQAASVPIECCEQVGPGQFSVSCSSRLSALSLLQEPLHSLGAFMLLLVIFCCFPLERGLP